MKYLLISLTIVAFSCHHKHKFIKAKWQGDTLTMYVDKDVDICLDSTVWFRIYTDSSVNIKRVDIIGKKDGEDTSSVFFWHPMNLRWYNQPIGGLDSMTKN